jgi:hypothetical protein
MNNLQVVKDKPKHGVIVIDQNSEQDLAVLIDDDGYLQRMKKRVTLRLSKGHFYKVNSSDDSPWDYTLVGYKYLNQYLGLKDHSPRSFKLHGREFTNPYIEYDNYNRPKKIYGLGVVGGRVGTNGKYHLEARYYEEDIEFQLVYDFIKKAQHKQDLLNYIDVNDKPQAGFAKYIVDEYDAIEVDRKHSEYRKVRSKHADNVKSGIQKLQSKVWRNAAKNHPAMALPKCIPFPIYSKDESKTVIDYGVNVDLVIWVDINDKDMEEAVFSFFSDLDANAVVMDHDEARDESDLDEDEYIDTVELVTVEDDELEDVEVGDMPEVDDEKKQLIDYITSSPVQIDLKAIYEKPLAEWNINQLRVAKTQIDQKANMQVVENEDC